MPHTTDATGLSAPGPAQALESILLECQRDKALWIFAYGSLLWRPEFEVAQQHMAKVHGWHRGLKMWSLINRGTPACPGLVFALIQGGSCWGQVQQVPPGQEAETLQKLWSREMPTAVYHPRWLICQTDLGPIKALAFTLPKSSPSYTGQLDAARYHAIMQDQQGGRFGCTWDYAVQTHQALQQLGIQDAALAALLKLARPHETP